MNAAKHTLLVSVLFLCITVSARADEGQRRRMGNATRVHLGPIYGFYTINTKHASQPFSQPGFLVGLRKEIHYDRSFKNYFSFGVDYFLNGLAFKSYYFKPDSVKLYDKKFAYSYSLFIHELHVPLHFKFLLKRADNSLYSPYIVGGYHLRYLVNSNLTVKQNSVFVKKDNPEVTFNTPLISKKLNAFVSLGFGWQKNNLASSKGSFFAELNFRYGFSPYTFETDYAATSLNINGAHLALALGFKL